MVFYMTEISVKSIHLPDLFCATRATPDWLQFFVQLLQKKPAGEWPTVEQSYSI